MAITSAGAGTGLDLEGVIKASVAAKQAQLQQPIITKQNSTNITLSGIGQLKSSISAFTDILDTLSKPGAFNKRAINITQNKDDPVLAVESKSGSSNGQYNITVNKLATTSRQEGIFDSSTIPLVTQDGELLSNVVYGVGQAAFLSDSSSTWTPSLNFTLFTTNVSSTNPLSRFHFFCAASSSL
jgi:flagellar hook-associated protein 2